MLEEDPEKEAERKTLSVRVTIIRNLIYHCYDHESLAVFFLFLHPCLLYLSHFSLCCYSAVSVCQGMWLMVVD